jgi:hypothetical protein
MWILIIVPLVFGNLLAGSVVGSTKPDHIYFGTEKECNDAKDWVMKVVVKNKPDVQILDAKCFPSSYYKDKTGE